MQKHYTSIVVVLHTSMVVPGNHAQYSIMMPFGYLLDYRYYGLLALLSGLKDSFFDGFFHIGLQHVRKIEEASMRCLAHGSFTRIILSREKESHPERTAIPPCFNVRLLHGVTFSTESSFFVLALTTTYILAVMPLFSHSFSSAPARSWLFLAD